VGLRPATHLLAIRRTERDAEDALRAIAAILAELGLEPKQAKTRIVHLHCCAAATLHVGRYVDPC
jgi:hypothetical protein